MPSHNSQCVGVPCWNCICVYSGKLDQAKELSAQLLAAYPSNASVVMLQALLLAKSGRVGLGSGLRRLGLTRVFWLMCELT